MAAVLFLQGRPLPPISLNLNVTKFGTMQSSIQIKTNHYLDSQYMTHKQLYIHNSNLIQQKLFRGRQMLLQGGNFFILVRLEKMATTQVRQMYLCRMFDHAQEYGGIAVRRTCKHQMLILFHYMQNPKPCTLSNFARITSMLFTPRTICPQKSQNLYTSPMIHGVIVIPSLCHPGLQRERQIVKVQKPWTLLITIQYR